MKRSKFSEQQIPFILRALNRGDGTKAATALSWTFHWGNE
jgi:hypothetical protein